MIRQHRLVRTLHIRVPEQLYLASSGSATPTPAAPRREVVYRRPTGRARDLAAGRATEGAAQPARGAAGATRRRTARRRFQLPPLPRRAEVAQTVLQPQYAPDLAPPRLTDLPEVFFWAPQPEPPRFVKPFVLPGYASQPTQPRTLDAEPRLELPTAERAVLNIPPLPESLNASRLLAPPPALPIRTTDSQTDVPQTGVSADPTRGDPTTVLSLSASAPPLPEFLAVPPGNIAGRLPEEASGEASGNELTGRRSGPGAGSGREQPGQAGAGQGDPARQTVAHPLPESQRRTARTEPARNVPASASARAESQTEPRAQAANATGSGAAPPESAQAEEPPRLAGALAAAAATRIAHPTGGVFDVVVQSSGQDGAPESAGVLSGRPVYSVYVHAGAPKDWTLQYCIPAGEDQSAEVSGPIVRLGNPAPLRAPFPTVTLRPPVHRPPGSYVMVHGFVSPAGRFQNLRVLGAVPARDADLVLAVLEQWEFRPAMRQGQPVRVEILLAIPAE
ncbi:MAG: energy transducer TonB [Bryobacteraceae bacterium]